MTGHELLLGFSYIDERFVAEADNTVRHRGVPWMKVLSVAACLCILMVGAFAMANIGHKNAMKETAAVPEAAPAATVATEAILDASRQEESSTESSVEAVTIPGELHHVPFAQLWILEETEEGFAVVVEAVSDEPTPLTVGMELTVVFDAAMIPGNTKEVVIDTRCLAENTLVAMENGTYDAGINTLYVVELFLLREAE